MDNCIFCKIIKGEIPSYKVYKDDLFYSFLDIYPVAEGHLLVIPKKHIEKMEETDETTIGGIFNVAKKIMPALKKVTDADYVQLVVAGEEVPHFHIHLFPRRADDGLAKFPTKTFDKEKSLELAEQIIQEL